MASGDIYQLNVDQVLYGQALTNVHYFVQQSNDPADPVGQSLIDAWLQELQPLQDNFQSEDLTTENLRAIRIFPLPSQPTNRAVTEQGGITGSAVTSSTAALGTLYAQPTTKQKTNKNFYAGIPQVSVTAGLLEQVIINLIVLFLAKLASQIVDGGTGTNWKRVVWDSIEEVGRDVATEAVRPASRKVRSRLINT